MSGVGKLLRRMTDGDELLAEWDRSDPARSRQRRARVPALARSGIRGGPEHDGAHYAPVSGDRLPVDAAEVILTTAMGGGASADAPAHLGGVVAAELLDG